MECVCHLNVRLSIWVSEQHTLLGDRGPQKRHQCFSSLLGGGSQILFTRLGLVHHRHHCAESAVHWLHQRRLPAKSVERDENYVLGGVLGEILRFGFSALAAAPTLHSAKASRVDSGGNQSGSEQQTCFQSSGKDGTLGGSIAVKHRVKPRRITSKRIAE